MKVLSYILCPYCKEKAYEKISEGKGGYYCEKCQKYVKKSPAKAWGNR